MAARNPELTRLKLWVPMALALITLASVVTPARGQVLHMLANLNSQPVKIAPMGQGAASGAFLAFPGNDEFTGTELWTLHDASGRARLAGDIASGAPSSQPTQIKSVAPNSQYFAFVANNGVSGPQVWTQQANEQPTQISSFSGNPETDSPTLVAENVGSIWFTYPSLTPGPNSLGLWQSTGSTPFQTEALNSLDSITYGPEGSNRWFFTGSSAENGTELWRVGTSAQVVDMADGPTGSDPRNLTVVGNYLYFSAEATPGERSLFRLPVTSGGPLPMNVIQPNLGTDIGEIAALPSGKIVFSASTPEAGSELWVSDGTSAGTSLLLDVIPGADGSMPQKLFTVGAWVYFTAYDGMKWIWWRTQGTTATTNPVGTVNGEPADLLFPTADPVNSRLLYWLAVPGGFELWSVSSLSSRIASLTELTDMRFVANNVYVTGGGSPGTFQLFRLISSQLRALTAPFGLLFNPKWVTPFPYLSPTTIVFTTESAPGVTDLWINPGTTLNSTKVERDQNEDDQSGDPREFVQLGNSLYFTATAEGVEDRRLWTTTGSGVSDANDWDNEPNGVQQPSDLTLHQGKLYLTALNSNSGARRLYQIQGPGEWGNPIGSFFAVASHLRTSGTRLFFKSSLPDQIQLMLLEGLSTTPVSLLSYDTPPEVLSTVMAGPQHLYFDGMFAYPNGHDGTEFGIWEEGLSGMEPLFLGVIPDVDFGDKALYSSDDGTGRALWSWSYSSVPDKLADVVPFTYADGKPAGVSSGGFFYFAVPGSGVWKTDGTPAGTTQVLEISTPDGRTFVLSGDAVYVEAHEDVTPWKRCLWKITETENTQVFEIGTIQEPADFSSIITAMGKVWFTISINDTRLHQYDTATGLTTEIGVINLHRLSQGFVPQLGIFNNHLVLGARQGRFGVEPTVLNYPPTFADGTITLKGRRNQPLSIPYNLIVTAPPTDLDDGAPEVRMGTITWDSSSTTNVLTRSGVPVANDDLVVPGDTFTFTPAPGATGQLGTFNLVMADAFNNTSSSIYLVFLTPEEEWRNTVFTEQELADPSISAPDADADKDGVANALEFVFGRDARQPDATALCQVIQTSPPVGEAPKFGLAFNSPVSLPTSATLIVEESPSLSSASWITIASRTTADPWTSLSGVQVQEGTATAGAIPTTVISTTEMGSGSSFLRLRVVLE